MSTSEKNSVFVELYDLGLTERKDDRFGRVATTKSLSESDLINIILTKGTDLESTTLKASIDLVKKTAINEIANGASVNFGLGFFKLSVNGIFIGDNAQWDSSQHSLSVQVTPSAELREAVKSVAVNVRGMASSGLVINSATDVASGEVNTTLTPGGGVNVAGSKIKIEGDTEGVGLTLTNKETGDVTTIPMTSVLINEPSKISFIVPAGLAAGKYALAITTQHSGTATLLKTPRTYTFEYELSVAEP